MEEITETIQDRLENESHAVRQVQKDRMNMRVVFEDETVDNEEVQEIIENSVDKTVFGFSVTQESSDATDGVVAVAEFKVKD